MSHTAGSLRIGAKHGCVVSDNPVFEVSGSEDVHYYGGHMVAESISKANARRIVACWNACIDVPTEQLEQNHSPFTELRDQFAGQAMQGAFKFPSAASDAEKNYLAMQAYKMADAMLQARQAAPSLLTELAQALDVLLQTTVDADINDGFVLTDETAEARSTALAVLAKVRGAA